jgi:hypothetical protein
MNKKPIKSIGLVAALTLAIGVGVVIGSYNNARITADRNAVLYGDGQDVVMFSGDRDKYRDRFQVNERGETFGISADVPHSGYNPDLVGVHASCGREGYARNSDLNDYLGFDRMMALNEQGYFGILVPVYLSDGVTVIGEFRRGIGCPLFHYGVALEPIDFQAVGEEQALEYFREIGVRHAELEEAGKINLITLEEFNKKFPAEDYPQW